jgi:K+-sensing histidine kinase KdpD
MKKLLQVFPFGIIIWPRSKGDFKPFTNKEFDDKIIKIKNDVDALKNIDVIISDNRDSDSINDIKIDFHNFLKSQQERLDDETSVVEQKANIQCNPALDHRMLMQDDSESSIIDRICNIKTSKVEWEGVSSFMHVLIDMTDFYKLDEAKNNIKLQKIMFASASHEFRTPLNAIMMSYEFIKSSFLTYAGKTLP